MKLALRVRNELRFASEIYILKNARMARRLWYYTDYDTSCGYLDCLSNAPNSLKLTFERAVQ